MSRRRAIEEPENHERWLVSYADFITLLFAFFVVMYAISSVNEGKYRTLSHSLMSAFQGPQRSLTPAQVGELARAEELPLVVVKNPEPVPKPPRQNLGETLESQRLKEISEEMVRQLSPLIEEGLVTVRRTDLWLEVEINTSILFGSGSDDLSRSARRVLLLVADVIRPYDNPVRIEGFTDDIPINTDRFPSNWELSAVRAASVVRLFELAGIDPTRMAAVGFGEFRPIDDNESESGRQRNRRVALVVLAGEDLRYRMDTDREATVVRPADVPARSAVEESDEGGDQ